jgi:hypothetical protein
MVSLQRPPSTYSNEALSRSASMERRGKVLVDHREHRVGQAAPSEQSDLSLMKVDAPDTS